MGANAQTSVPTFTAGDVLTAANMNISARTGVPVFADTTARDAAFGGTGEKVLAEGQLCYLESTNVVQYYDGSVWATVGPASAGGLVFISATTIGSAVASVTVSNAFSATYDNYRIIVSGGAGSASANLAMTLGATTTGYYGYGTFGAYSTGTPSGTNNNNDTAWGSAAGMSTNSLQGIIDLTDPFNTKRTHITVNRADSATAGNSRVYGGFLDNATSYTAFTLTTSTGTMTGGTVRVYGYANS